MYETYWLVLVAVGLLTTIVAVWGPDPYVTIYAGLFSIGIWIAVGNGATNLVAVSGGVEAGPYGSRAVQVLAFGNALAMVIPLFVGLYEWAADDDDQDASLSAAGQQEIEDALSQ